jgi:O-antigen/teichoic acid export membrane protein
MAATIAFMTTRLVTVPVVIRYLGMDGYGIWSIIMVTAAYMRFGSAGIKCAFQKYVAEATGNGDYERANRLISTGTALMLGLSIVGLTPVLIFAKSLAKVSGVPDQFLGPASASISLLGVIIFAANVGAGFESIITGAQRFDLIRKINIVASLSEATCIVTLLHLGKGLFAMSAVMAASEISYICLCVFLSRSVLPQVRILPRYVTRTVVREFITFAGSYQLVNVQEIIYSTIMPLAVLKFFGAAATGAFSVVGRLVQAALMPQDSFLLPILSGSSLVFASGSVERMKVLVLKAFKTTYGLSILPLGVVCAAGTTVLYAWTGHKDGSFRTFLLLMSLAGLFQALSLLQLVLYRASGKSLMDNVRQAIRIVILLVIGLLGGYLGLKGILAGLAFAELCGMVFMFLALRHAFRWFSPSLLFADALKLTGVAIATAFLSASVLYLPIPWVASERAVAVIRTCAVGGLTALAAIPLLLLTGALSRSELRVIRDFLPLPRRKAYASS